MTVRGFQRTPDAAPDEEPSKKNLVKLLKRSGTGIADFKNLACNIVNRGSTDAIAIFQLFASMTHTKTLM